MDGHVSSPDSASTNPNIILLAGAGASYILGFPTLNDILQQVALGTDDVAQRIINTKNAIVAYPGRFRTAVFEELIVKLKDYIRISETLRTDNTYRSELGQIPNDVNNGTVEFKWKKALTKCYRVLLETYGPNNLCKTSREFDTTLKLLKELARVNAGCLHVYTTNYDCSYQALASKCSDIAFLSHIDNADGKFQERIWSYSRPDQINSNLPTIYLHRLHGCVAWFNTRASDDDAGFVSEVFGAGDKLEINDDDYLNKMCIKLIATQLMGTNPAFSSAFEEFTLHLQTAKVLLVWGYSFHDLEVVRQINQACNSRTPPLKIYYIDPYLSVSEVVNNIRLTLRNAPIQISSVFKPRQIDWKPTDGLEALVSAVIRKVEKGE